MKNLLAILLFFSFAVINAQQEKEKKETKKERQQRYINEGNPFKKYGYTPKIATLSKGKYREFFVDTIIQIGSFQYNRVSKEITGFTLYNKEKLSEADLQPELVSRWMSPDPLTDEFPSWSPYNSFNDNPIRYNDPTGLASEDIIFKFIGDKKKSSKAKLQSVFDNALGQGFASINKNGKLEFNGERSDLKTDEQRNFYDAISDAYNDTSDTVIKVADHSTRVSEFTNTGAFKEGKNYGIVDIDDVKATGVSDPAMNEKSVLAHEVMEQYSKQVIGGKYEKYDFAHEKGREAEEKVTGYKRGTTSYTNPKRSRGRVSFTATIPFTKGNVTRTSSYTVVNGQVIKRK